MCEICSQSSIKTPDLNPNQLSGFYMRATLALNGLNKYDHFQNFKIIISTPSLSSPTFSSNGTNKKSIRKHELVRKKNRCLRHETCMKPVFFLVLNLRLNIFKFVMSLECLFNQSKPTEKSNNNCSRFVPSNFQKFCFVTFLEI